MQTLNTILYTPRTCFSMSASAGLKESRITVNLTAVEMNLQKCCFPRLHREKNNTKNRVILGPDELMQVNKLLKKSWTLLNLPIIKKENK